MYDRATHSRKGHPVLTATYTATITVEINPRYYPEAGDDPETLRRILEEEINADGDLSVLLDGDWGPITVQLNE